MTKAVRALALVLVLVPVAGRTAPEPERFVRAVRDVTAVPFDGVVLPAHAPVPAWSEGIGPGAMLVITIGSSRYICTANYVWTTSTKRYLGAAGHCFLPTGKKATHGPGADFNASGVSTLVCVDDCIFGGQSGAQINGTFVALGAVAYARQTGSGGDIGNDFGLVEIPSSLWPQIRPAMPVFGGPSGTDTATAGKIVCHYGNAMGLGEVFLTKARAGSGASQTTNVWRALTPALQGDSGSAVNVCKQDAGGLHGFGAVGVLTHLSLGVPVSAVAGTTIARAKTLASEAGLTITQQNG